MKKVLSVAIVTLLAAASVNLMNDPVARSESKTPKSERLLRHVVLFGFKENADPAKVEEVIAAFRALPQKIDAIHDFEWGTDVSPEKLSQGFTHCFLLTFKNQEDFNVYLPHPDHQAFAKSLAPVLEKVLVVDYWTGE